MPVLFFGHGSPMNVVQENPFTLALDAYGKTLPRPTSILMVSAHWAARSTMVTFADKPAQIYDFYGFPDELYRVTYTPPASPELSRRAAALLGLGDHELSADWGIDHGAWSVLMRLFPDADIPVVQVALDMTKPPAYHYNLGKLLAPLREEGVLIIGSGNIVHNLRDISYDQFDPRVEEWAEQFDDMVAEDLASLRHERLVAFDAAYGDLARRAHPTLDHYLPLLYAAGAAGDDAASYIYEGFQHGSLSMRCVRFGGL
jgi:4,5-DOPA dioxygenase extradiol